MTFQLHRWPNGNWHLRTDWQWIIRLAWGKRRISSRADAGTMAYPESVGANVSMWLDWVKQNLARSEPHIVVTPRGADHGEDYLAVLAARTADKTKAAHIADVTARLADLHAAREIARANKDFSLADKIRSEIERAGIIVNDARIK